MLRHLFPSREIQYVGLDITASAVKLLSLNRHRSNYQITAFAHVPLDEGCVVDKEIKEIDAVTAAIKKALSISRTPAKFAAIALADSSVITKIIRVDKGLSELEMEEHVMLEADKHIPYPLDEVCVDFQILGETKEAPEYLDVLLAASRSETVDSYVDAVNASGLTLGIVDVESYAERKACYLFEDKLPNEGKDKTIAIVDIGAQRINLTILDDFMPIFTRTELLGGDRLGAIISSRYGLSPSEAQEGKISNTLPEDYNITVLPKFEEDVVQHISRALQFYSSVSQSDKIDHIALVGGSATLPGLAPLIKDQLKIQTAIANPIANMSIHSRVDKSLLEHSTSGLMICCGLALRSFDK